MKTTLKHIFIAICFLGGLVNAHSQTIKQRENITKNYDKVALRNLQERLNSEYKNNYNRALILAKQNNWPLVIEKADGGVSELQGVSDEGIPLYYTTTNVGSAITSRTNKIQPGGSLGLNLTGAGMFAGVWEQTRPIDHKDFGSRIYNFDNSGATETGFHATHVTGTIISDGANNAAGKGMAPDGWVWISNWANDLTEMASAATSGMLVSNHSYGLISDNLAKWYFGAYMSTSKDLDRVLYDAPYYQAIVAAGNDRDDGVNPDKFGYDLLTKYTTSKNAIVVAATYQVLDYTGPNSVLMSGFSCWGPTDDNRIKPDISTKGVSVFSTDDNPNLIGYSNSNGTSMAAPGITGSLLLLQQYYSLINNENFMLSATLRGLMIHTASEAGSYPGPDPKFGWGLMDSGKAAQVITDSKNSSNVAIISELNLKQGVPYTKQVTVSGNQPLIATIDWTDLPGKAVSNVEDSKTPVLVNDLDIRITKDNVVYFPWKLATDYTGPAIKGDNSVDNVEKIEIDLPSPGTYTITVTNKGTLVGGKQDFSLIVTGGTTLSLNDTVFETFNVWPNPINDVLNVSIESQLSDDVYVTVYDIQGKRIVNQKLDFSNDFFNGEINVDYLSPGIYLVKVMQGDKESVRKIIKK